MFCANCGQELFDYMLFCPECGEKVLFLKNNGSNASVLEDAYRLQAVGESGFPSFNVLHHNIAPAPNRIAYNQLRKHFCELAFFCVESFQNLYSINKSLKDVVSNSPEQAFQAMKPAIDDCINTLLTNGIFSIDNEHFYATYIYPREKWTDAYQIIADQYAEVILDKEQKAAYRKRCRENRGRWVGGGFGVQGAIKGAVTAGAMNMLTGAGYMFLNSVGGIISSIAASFKLDKIFENTNTFDTLAQGVWNTVFSMHIGLAICLSEQTGKSDIIDGSVSEQADKTAAAMLNNIPLIKEPIQKENVLIEAFLLNPYSEKWYETVYESYGDTNGELERLANYFGISVVSDLKEISLVELYNQFSIKTELDALQAKRSLLELRAELHYTSTSDVLENIEKILRQFDIEARTVDDILFDTREEAEFNRAEQARFSNIISSVDVKNMESLKTAYSEMQNFTGKLAECYRMNLTQQIQDLDLQLRTVSLPVENEPDIIYESVEEAEDAREYAEALFGLLDKRPAESNKRLCYYKAIVEALEKEHRINTIPEVSNVFVGVLCSLMDDEKRSMKYDASDIQKHYCKLQDNTKKRLYLGDYLKSHPEISRNVIDTYLSGLGFQEDEDIYVVYDNTTWGLAGKGFTITSRGFYSTGCSFVTGRFFLPTDEIEIYRISVEGSRLIVNDKLTDIDQSSWLTRDGIADIVKCYLITNMCSIKYSVTIPPATKSDNCR